MNPDLIILGKDPDNFDERNAYSRWLLKCPDCGLVRSVGYQGMLRSKRLGRSWCLSCCHKAEHHGRFEYIENVSGKIIVIEQHVGHNPCGQPLALVECPDCGRQRIMQRSSIKQRHRTLCRLCSCRRGSDHPCWRGGRWPRLSPSLWHEIAEYIRERDFHTCQYPDCDATSTSEKELLSVHHILSLREGGDNSEHNLISLCRCHHRWAEVHLNESVPMFDAIVAAIYEGC